jgi:hypothetical protein
MYIAERNETKIGKVTAHPGRWSATLMIRMRASLPRRHSVRLRELRGLSKPFWEKQDCPRFDRRDQAKNAASLAAAARSPASLLTTTGASCAF